LKFREHDAVEPKAKFTDMLHEGLAKDNTITGKGESGVRGVKTIVQDNIIFRDTTDSKGIRLNIVEAIDEVFAKLGRPREEIVTLDPKSTDPNVKASYELMSAQTHVARPLQWLSERHDLRRQEN
jgi:hypothetical protein